MCQKSNPDDNSFCGYCGQPLAINQLPSNYPREGFDEVDEPEIQQIDPRIPANEYSRPRVTSRSEPVADDEEFQSTVTRAVKASESTRDIKPAAPTARKGSSTSIFGLDDIDPPKSNEPPKNIDSPRFDTDPYTVKPVAMSNSMFDFEPAEGSSRNAIHGPSFLGLSDPEFLDEDDEPSHSHRAWLLVALAVVIVIAGMQWRNIRDTGMHYAGTLHFKLPLKKGEGQAQVAQEKAAPGDGSENSSAGEGKPEMEVNPTTNGATPANQGNATGDQSGEENLLTAQGSGVNATKPADSSKLTSNTANAKPAKQSQPPAADADKAASAGDANASTNDSQENVAKSSDKGSKKSEVAEALPPKSKPERVSRASEKASIEPPAPKPAPGADDVARAISASDPATAANWLWAATKKGNKEAPVLLADYYARGRGVPKDCEQATVLLRSAARAGNPRASARLGMYYATGQCVGQDRAEAWHWLSLAHEKDPSSDWVEQYRRRLWTQMTPDERARSGSGPSASE